MVSTGPGRSGSRWKRAQLACVTLAEMLGTPCFLCHRPIHWEFTRLNPRHSMAGTVHHIIGLAQGGDPLDPANHAPAHRGCNTRESNRVRALLKRQRDLFTSQLW